MFSHRALSLGALIPEIRLLFLDSTNSLSRLTQHAKAALVGAGRGKEEVG